MQIMYIKTTFLLYIVHKSFLIVLKVFFSLGHYFVQQELSVHKRTYARAYS